MLAFYVFCFPFVMTSQAQANWASRFSLAGGEVYSDNIFFSRNKESDFVTLLAPTLSFAYKPSGYPEPTFNVGLSAPVEIFTQHSERNNIGDNLSLDSSYLYRYSPRLDFTFTDHLLRRGESRIGGLGETSDGEGSGEIGSIGGLGGARGGSSLGGMGSLGESGGSGGFGGIGGGGCGRSGISGGRSGTALESGDLISRGERLENQVGGNVNFKYSPNVSSRGGYCWDATWFIGGGGKETVHSVNIESGYKLWRQHNLRVRYSISLLRSRNGKDDIVHDFDIGDDFLSEREIRLTPTLIIRAATGIAVRTSGDSKFRLEYKFNLEVRKVWQTALLTVGVDRRLTGSFGVSGPSFTTEFFGRFSMRLSQYLTGFIDTEWALFDAEKADFATFQAMLGFQYWLTHWLSANLAYQYSWSESNGGTLARDVLGRGKVESNSVMLFLAVHFNVWPHLGLSREGAGLLLGPALRSPARSSSASRAF